MTRAEVVAFLRRYRLAVQASNAAGGAPQAAVVAYPDGRDRLAWPGITHVRVRPTWLRYSDFTCDPPRIVELRTDQLD